MFIWSNKLLLCLLGMSFSISEYNARRGKKTDPDLLKDEQSARKEKLDAFQQKLKQVEARFVAILNMFPLADSFYNALNFLHKDMDQFYNMSQSMGKMLNLNLKKDWSTIQKTLKSVQSEMYTTSSLKDQIEIIAEKIKKECMLLENDLVNGKNSTNFVDKKVQALRNEGNNNLDKYVQFVSKLFDVMSKFRHELVGFGQKLVRSLSETGSINAMSIIENKFCRSEIITKGTYKEAFQKITESFNQMKSAFTVMNQNGGDAFPSSFVTFASKVLEFQNIKFYQLETAISLYNEGSTGEDKYKSAVALASAMIDFNYLYELSKHIMKLFQVSQEAFNANQNAGSANNGGTDE
jgi:hypothetical protein